MSGRHRHHRLHACRWAATRRAVFKRDGYRCTECGGRGRLECHHVVPLETEPGQNPYAMAGLATVCRSCHIAMHRQDRRRPLTPEEQAWSDAVAAIVERKTA